MENDQIWNVFESQGKIGKIIHTPVSVLYQGLI